MIVVGFEDIGSVSGKWNISRIISRLSKTWFLFLVLTWGNENAGSVFVTPVVESFSLDFLWALISYWAESRWKSCQTCTMELFGKISQRSQHIDYFCKKVPSVDVWLDSICICDWKCCKYEMQVHGICKLKLLYKEVIVALSCYRKSSLSWFRRSLFVVQLAVTDMFVYI